ncbi:MAG: efflux transporter outer membrane subunit [Gammaproteobacteria bacterium]|jgi:multidrug efflux system outer membrane protein
MRAARITSCSALLLLAGCMVGPDYQRPELDLPVEFQGTVQEGESIANLQWWELFQDPQLNELVQVALEQNRDLRVAIARVDEARARLGITRADQFPTLDGAASARRGNTAEQIVPGVGIQENYFLGLSAAYEVDLWGKFRRSTEAARADLLASEDNQRTVLITLVADVASAYLLLRDLDARVRIAADTLEARQKSTQLIQARFEKGTVPLLDVNQAQIQEALAAAQLASLQRQVFETENLLNVLLGRNPRPLVRGRELNAGIISPDVPAGLPANLLERRPDIRAAEQRLAAQTARIGVAKSLRIPSVSLTASGGLASNDLSDLLESDAKLWGVGIDILGPIFDAGKRRSQVEVELARTEQALNQYEQSILQALQEVEDALAGVRWYREERIARDFQVEAAQSASNLSWARYDGGVTSYLEVLDSDRSLFNAQLEASQVRRLQLTAIVRLYRALGGGWVTVAQ